MEYIQITSGRGPVECCRVVVLIMNKIVEQAKCLNYALEIIEHEDGPNDGCMFSATLAIEGENISSLKGEWEGSVLWVAQKNPFRPWHRRKNWFVGVHFFKPLQSDKVNERDISYETLRSSAQEDRMSTKWKLQSEPSMYLLAPLCWHQMSVLKRRTRNLLASVLS